MQRSGPRRADLRPAQPPEEERMSTQLERLEPGVVRVGRLDEPHLAQPRQVARVCPKAAVVGSVEGDLADDRGEASARDRADEADLPDERAREGSHDELFAFG